MTKILIVIFCFLFIQKAEAQDDMSLSNQLVVDMGVGASGAYSTDLMIKKAGTSILYTPVAQMFLKKYFAVEIGNIEIPLYMAAGVMVHLSSNPSKPIMPEVRVGGMLFKYVTPFFTRVWQKAGTTDYTSHPDNKNYWGYGVEFNKRLTENGLLYMTISKNDRHILAMVSMGFIF